MTTSSRICKLSHPKVTSCLLTLRSRYGNDDNQPKPTEAAPPQSIQPKQEPSSNADVPAPSIEQHGANGMNMDMNMNGNVKQEADDEPQVYGENIYEDDNIQHGQIGYGRDDNIQSMQNMNHGSYTNEHGFSGTVGTKEDG